MTSGYQDNDVAFCGRNSSFERLKVNRNGTLVQMFNQKSRCACGLLQYIYNGSIFPSLNHAKRTPIIGP